MGKLKCRSMKTLKIKVDSTLKYLQVFNGILELTDKELLVLSKFIDLSDTVNLCSTENKKAVAKSLNMEDHNTLNNYVKKLKDKGAIKKNKNGYALSPILLPQKSINLQIFYSNE
jgi:predicted transcriptional regulator